MRRQRRPHHYDDDNDYRPNYQQLNGHSDDFLQMERLQAQTTQQPKFENTIEAKVEEGDTLQAMALRFHCTVGDIKRLNKIDKDNEIYARKVVKIPVTLHSVLLQTMPAVHKSGNSSPRHVPLEEQQEPSHITRNPLEDAKTILEEKLLVASVNSAGGISAYGVDGVINSIILKSNNSPHSVYADEDFQRHSTSISDVTNDATSPLLSGILDDTMPQPHPIRGPSLSTIDWSGSDCDMSWVCLFVVILALCFVIPLLYIIYLAEHPHHHNTTTH